MSSILKSHTKHQMYLSSYTCFQKYPQKAFTKQFCPIFTIPKINITDSYSFQVVILIFLSSTPLTREYIPLRSTEPTFYSKICVCEIRQCCFKNYYTEFSVTTRVLTETCNPTQYKNRTPFTVNTNLCKMIFTIQIQKQQFFLQSLN